MPFKVDEALQQINRLKYKWGEQVVEIKYNAGEKYAKLEERIDKEGLDQLGQSDEDSENGGPSISELRVKLCELLCMVVEEWDVEKGDKKVPINPKQMASLGLPLEFYSGMSSAISEDFADRAGGTKRSR